jgi:WD40 repeat protein
MRRLHWFLMVGYAIAAAPTLLAQEILTPHVIIEENRLSILCVAFSPDSKTLAAGCADSTIILWDMASGETIASLNAHAASVHSVAFSPNGKILASGSGDKTIRLWDVKTGKTVAVLEGCKDAVQSVAFSPDGKLLASGTLNGHVDLWDTETGKRIFTKRIDVSGTSLTFSPDGKMLAAGFDGEEEGGAIHLWDVKKAK